MEEEISALSKAVVDPPRPYTVILGGVKCDDSLDIALNLLERGQVDTIVPVGLVGNLMLWASEHSLGEGNEDFIRNSLDGEFERTWEMATKVVEKYSEKLLLPIDLAVEIDGERVAISVGKLPTEHPIYDVGLGTLMRLRPVVMGSGCVLWNGPASYFEKPDFAFGTIEILNTCSETDAFVIIGGGHTSTLVVQRGLSEKIGHNSTGGGACLTFLADKRMPALEALALSADKFG